MLISEIIKNNKKTLSNQSLKNNLNDIYEVMNIPKIKSKNSLDIHTFNALKYYTNNEYKKINYFLRHDKELISRVNARERVIQEKMENYKKELITLEVELNKKDIYKKKEFFEKKKDIIKKINILKMKSNEHLKESKDIEVLSTISQLIIDEIKKYAVNKDFTVYKGISLERLKMMANIKNNSKKSMEEILSNIKNKNLVDKGFLSTSVDYIRGSTFALDGVILKINVKKGVKGVGISAISKNPKEGEVLFLPKQKIKVDSWKKDERGRCIVICSMEESESLTGGKDISLSKKEEAVNFLVKASSKHSMYSELIRKGCEELPNSNEFMSNYIKEGDK